MDVLRYLNGSRRPLLAAAAAVVVVLALLPPTGAPRGVVILLLAFFFSTSMLEFSFVLPINDFRIAVGVLNFVGVLFLAELNVDPPNECFFCPKFPS